MTRADYKPGGYSAGGTDQSCRGAGSGARAIHRGGEFPTGYAVVPTGRRSVTGAAHDCSSRDATRRA